jgi:hypothetical protein
MQADNPVKAYVTNRIVEQTRLLVHECEPFLGDKESAEIPARQRALHDESN